MSISRDLLSRMYTTEGKSAHQIAQLIDCSDQKVNYWLAKHGIKKRSISEATYVYRNPNGDPFSFQQPTQREDMFLMGLGLGLYWGEGGKKDRLSVRLGNTDPDLVRTFLRFLIRIYDVREERLRFGLQIFSDMNPEQAKLFWVRKLSVSPQQFGKIIVTPARSIGTYKEKTRHGVLTVYFSNTKLRRLIGSQIEELRFLS